MDMWNAPMVQSRRPLTYRLMESMGLGGQDDMEAADRGIAESTSSRQSTLMIDYLEIWCEIRHACSKQAIWKGAH